MTAKPLKLILGTSADPIHEGHVQLLVEAVKALSFRGFQIAEVVLLPVYRHHSVQDNIKHSLPLSYDDRFALCQLAATEIKAAIKGITEHVNVSDLEKELVWQTNRPNFTAETMEAMRKRSSHEVELAFLVGADSFSGSEPGFKRWYHWQDLVRDVILVLIPRKGIEPNRGFIDSLLEQGGRTICLDEISVKEVSSGQIRNALVNGVNLGELVKKGWLSQEIAKYIAESKLIQIWKNTNIETKPENFVETKMETESIESRIGKLLIEQKLSLSLAESCTGGLIGHRITNVPGSSEYYMGSIVSYAYEAKVNLLGVSWETLEKHGAVSSETVIEMAQGSRKAFNTDVAVAVCCIAGPGGATSEKPLGTSWIGLSCPGGNFSYHFQFLGNRESVKEQVSQRALEILLTYLEER